MLLDVMEEKFQCRFEGKHRQRDLEGSRVNMTSQMNGAVKRGEREMGSQGQWPRGQRAKGLV